MDIVECANQTDEDAAFAAGALIVIRTDLLPPPPPTYEDLTTYTEVDPSGMFSETASTITYTNLTRNVSAYAYKDYGVNHFTGDFSIDYELKVTAASASGSQTGAMMLNNTLNNQDAVRLAGGNMQGILIGKDGTGLFICQHECCAGTVYNTSFFRPSLNTTYYMRFSRDSSVGTYGTLTLKIYSNSARTTLLTTLTSTLHSVVSFRYLDLVQSINTSNSQTISGTLANIALS